VPAHQPGSALAILAWWRAGASMRDGPDPVERILTGRCRPASGPLAKKGGIHEAVQNVHPIHRPKSWMRIWKWFIVTPLGIDVGNEAHYVAGKAGNDSEGEPVRRFACLPATLQKLAAWLLTRSANSGRCNPRVYWIPLFDILEAAGLEVYLVNPRQTRNLPGRKKRCAGMSMAPEVAHAWACYKTRFTRLRRYGACGTLWRQRADHVRAAGRCIQRMQKALIQMNLQ